MTGKRFVALVVAGLALLLPASAGAVRVVPHAASCGNSFDADGHPGPWWTSGGGGTRHGNFVHIDCPSSSTHWDITYRIQVFQNGSWTNSEVPEHRSGNGSPTDFAYSYQPRDCDAGIFLWRTHVDNNVTGGNINKPAGGGGVHLSC